MKFIALILMLVLSQPILGYHLLEDSRVNYLVVREAQKILPTCTEVNQETPFMIGKKHYIGRCQIHGPNQYNPKSHMGVSVYIKDGD